MRKNIKFIIYSIIFLFLISIITYLPYFKHLGFINDDWYLVYGGENFGASRFFEIFASDRPYRAYLQSILFSIFRIKFQLYFFLALIVRFLGAIGVYWIGKIIWKSSKIYPVLIAVIFLVFPGFLEQPHAFDYQAHQFAMTLMIFSIAFSVKSILNKKVWQKIIYYFFSAFFAISSYLLMEYYIGMEGYRLLFIGLVVWNLKNDNLQAKFKRIILSYIPFIIAPIIFLRWRIFIFEGTRPATNIDNLFSSISTSSLSTIIEIFKKWFIDIVDISFGAFFNPLSQLLPNLSGRDFISAIILGILAILIMSLFIKISNIYISRDENKMVESKNQSGEIIAFIILGLMGAMICLLPINIAQKDVSYIQFNRFSFPSALGISVFFVGILSILGSRKLGYMIIASMLFVSVLTQYSNNVRYADDWSETQKFWQEFVIRVPGLNNETTLTGFHQGSIQEGYSIWSPVNLIYRFENPQISISAEVLNKDVAKNIEMDLPYKKNHRSFEFQHDYEKLLVFTKPTDHSCLRIIDHKQIEISIYDDLLIQIVAPFSNIELINRQNQINFDEFNNIFNIASDNKNWCFYYENASLARQFQNWTEIITIGTLIEENNLHPFDSLEWMPFIQAYAYQNDFEKANNLITIINQTPYYRFQACNNFSNLLDKSPSNKSGNEYLVQAFCND